MMVTGHILSEKDKHNRSGYDRQLRVWETVLRTGKGHSRYSRKAVMRACPDGTLSSIQEKD